MIHTAVKRNRDYSGPKSIPEVIRLMVQEASKEKKDLSEELILTILATFFSATGIWGYVRSKGKVFIDGFGTFVHVKKKRKKGYTCKSRSNKKRRKGVVSRKTYQNRMERMQQYNHQVRIIRCRNELRLWELKNIELQKNGLKPWSFRDYCSIIRETELIEYRRIVREQDRKKIEDLKAGIFECGDTVRISDTGKLKVFHSHNDDNTSYVCAINKDYSPNIAMWGNINRMKKVRTDMLKAHIDEKLFFT